MTQSQNSGAWTDEQLVAFLDGVGPADEAAAITGAAAEDASLAQRLADLSPDLEAMREGMAGVLTSAPSMTVPEPAPRSSIWRWATAAVVAAFALGFGMQTLLTSKDNTADWHQAVADYQVLYTAETVTATPLAAETRAAGLAHVSNRLGLDVTEADISVDGLTFQRAQILAHEGKPLAQLVYLDAEQRPIAFCIMRLGGETAEPADTELAGLSATTWSKGGLDFIVIGPADPTHIRQAAEVLLTRLPG